MDEQPERWLCRSGPYADYIVAMSRLDPTFRLPDRKSKIFPLKNQSHITLLTMQDRSPPTRCDFSEVPNLEQHLSNTPEPAGRIFIIEGLSHEVIAFLGWRFKLPPRFFADHERNTLWAIDSHETGNTPLLPSSSNNLQNLRFDFYELRSLGLAPKDLQVSCADTGRHFGFHKFFDFDDPTKLRPGKISKLGILRRRCSFWSDTESSGKCWNVIILCDPPLKCIREGTAPSPTYSSVNSELFQGGYTDFTDHLKFNPSPRGPSRTSMLEDICFYIHEFWRNDNTTNDPELIKIIIRKIVASQYAHFVEYLRSLICEIAWRLSRRETLDLFSQRWVELQWSNLQSLIRRLTEYIEDVDSILLGHQNQPKQAVLVSERWTDSELDFRTISQRLEKLRYRAQQLLDSMTGLASIVGNKQAVRESKRSLREAKTVKSLTVIGIVLAPLALCCGIFSMSDAYLPGADHFWLYFAVGIPLILVVVVIFFLVDIGLDDEGVWLFSKVQDSLRAYQV